MTGIMGTLFLSISTLLNESTTIFISPMKKTAVAKCRNGKHLDNRRKKRLGPIVICKEGRVSSLPGREER